MKRLFSIILTLLLSPSVLAFDFPEIDILDGNEDRAPRGEVLEYKGEMYVKRYRYIMHLNGYAATIQRASEANKIDSIYRVINREANGRMAIHGKDYIPAAGEVRNIEEVKYIAQRVLGRRWIKRLTQSGSYVRINIVASPLLEVLYLDISYISEDYKLDQKMIKLQEILKKRAKFKLRATFRTVEVEGREKHMRLTPKGYSYYYMFWVTNLSAEHNKIYLSRGVSIAE